MKTIYILKVDDSMDGRGPMRTLFAVEDLDTIGDWLDKKYPENKEEWSKIRKGGTFASYQYMSYSVTSLPIFTAEDLSKAEEEYAKLPELERELEAMKKRIEAVKKLKI